MLLAMLPALILKYILIWSGIELSLLYKTTILILGLIFSYYFLSKYGPRWLVNFVKCIFPEIPIASYNEEPKIRILTPVQEKLVVAAEEDEFADFDRRFHQELNK